MEFMTVQGKQVPYTPGRVPVSECELDPQNPRIQYLVGLRAGAVTQEQLEEMIWAKDAVKMLAQSILQNGGVYDPVIVQRQRNGEGNYKVREGNCRTVACRHLLVQHPDDGRFTTMPAMVFDADLGEEDLAVILASEHVAGKIRHDAYEQAKQVYDLYHKYGKPYEWLSNHLRLSKSKIREMLSAYAAMTEFLAAHRDPEHIRKFSLFVELMKKPVLRDKFEQDPEFKRRFHRLLLEGLVTDSKQVRDLPTILAHPEATNALETKGYEEAHRALVRDDPSLASDLFWAVKSTTEKLKAAPVQLMLELATGDKMEAAKKVILLRNLHRAVEDLATLAGIKL